MIGTKRRSVSLNSNADDNPFQSKKAIAESPLSGPAASVSPSRESETAATPPLDRRKAARQHVRALNTEFASWVQSQFQDHPDELWEDGVKDYLTEASHILEKFTDVVKWLKAKSGGEGSASILATQSSEKKNSPESNSKELKSAPSTFKFGMPSANASLVLSSNSGASSTQASIFSSTASSAASFSFGLSASSQALTQSASTAPATSWSSGVSFDTKSTSPVKTFSFSTSPNFGVSSNNQAVSVATTASFISSTSPGLFSNSQIPTFGGSKADSQPSFMFGNQKPIAVNDSAKVDAEEDNEPEQPSSPSVKRSEEKGISVVHETKCKLYIKSTDPADKEPWKDKGAGKLFIKCEEGAGKGTKESKPRILVRNDVGRVMLNASLYPGIKTNLQKNAIVSILHTMDDNEGSGKAVARTFLIRVKNEEERNKLADTIQEHAPAT